MNACHRECCHLLQFDSLHRPGRALAFPCSETGVVDLDRLSERASYNYFYARAVVGREFTVPTVRRLPQRLC